VRKQGMGDLGLEAGLGHGAHVSGACLWSNHGLDALVLERIPSSVRLLKYALDRAGLPALSLPSDD
jgi:hypothetical protein